MEKDDIDEMKAKRDKLQEKVVAVSSNIYEAAAQASQAASENSAEVTSSDDNVKEANYEEK